MERFGSVLQVIACQICPLKWVVLERQNEGQSSSCSAKKSSTLRLRYH